MDWTHILYGFLILAFGGAIYYGSLYYLTKKHIFTKVKHLLQKLDTRRETANKELTQKEVTLKYKERRLEEEYNKLKESLNASYDKKYKQIAADYKEQLAQKERDLNEAIEAAQKELAETIETVDKAIGDRITNLTLNNTLTFDCACGERNIPCFIDLTKENTFRCKKCNSVYSVYAKFSPVMIGKAASEEDLQKLIEKRLQEVAENEGV